MILGACLGMVFVMLIVHKDVAATFMPNEVVGDSEVFNVLMLNLTFAYGHAMFLSRNDEVTPTESALTWFLWALQMVNIDRVGGNMAATIARLVFSEIRDSDVVPDSSMDDIWIWLLVPMGAAIALTFVESNFVMPMMGQEKKAAE